jgi:uncharacterized protein
LSKNTIRTKWRRLDNSGFEESLIEETGFGWNLTGQICVNDDTEVHLKYEVRCDQDWRTRFALISNVVRDDTTQLEISADGEGNWMLGTSALPNVHGALDIDLGFTPATNTLPIRRLNLAVGESAEVTTAWVRFPELKVEPLNQSYTREASAVYRYVAVVDGEIFQAQLDTDEFGRVLKYEGLWVADPGSETHANGDCQILTPEILPPSVNSCFADCSGMLRQRGSILLGRYRDKDRIIESGDK